MMYQSRLCWTSHLLTMLDVRSNTIWAKIFAKTGDRQSFLVCFNAFFTSQIKEYSLRRYLVSWSVSAILLHGFWHHKYCLTLFNLLSERRIHRTNVCLEEVMLSRESWMDAGCFFVPSPNVILCEPSICVNIIDWMWLTVGRSLVVKHKCDLSLCELSHSHHVLTSSERLSRGWQEESSLQLVAVSKILHPAMICFIKDEPNPCYIDRIPVPNV